MTLPISAKLRRLIAISITLYISIHLSHAATTWTVTTTGDIGGTCDNNAKTCTTLRAAINVAARVTGDPDANANNIGDTLIFSQEILTSDADSRTIHTATTLQITDKNLTIDASPSGIILDGGHTLLQQGHTVFEIDSSPAMYVNLRHLTFQNGYSQSDGGGIIANATAQIVLDHCRVVNNETSQEGGGIVKNGVGTLKLLDSTVTGNTAGFEGGGIFQDFGTLVIDRSTIDHNTATLPNGHGGGGICILKSQSNGNAPLVTTITNSTIANNQANLGGGIASESTLTLSNSTVAYNKSTDLGAAGGLLVADGSASLFSTIVAENQSPQGLGYIQNQVAVNTGAGLTSRGYNLIGAGDNGGITTSPATHDQVIINPQIPLLASNEPVDNGGPTYTFALESGAPALGKGNCDATVAQIDIGNTDQRGFSRPTTQCDVGALADTVFIGGFE